MDYNQQALEELKKTNSHLKSIKFILQVFFWVIFGPAILAAVGIGIFYLTELIFGKAA